MRIAKVIGTVTLSRCHPALQRYRWIIGVPYSLKALRNDAAPHGEDVVVLAHGFFNYMIGRSLKKLGWKLVESEGYKYWSMRRFERA